MEQIPFQPIQLSSDTLTLNNTPSPIIDSDSQTDVFYAEDEIILKDKNICSFVNLPNETKSFLQLDRYDNSMQSSMFSGLTSWKNTPIAFGRNLQKITEEKLKSTLNKMYYRKAKVLLNERFGEGIDEENIEEFDFNDNGENSPKTTYEQEFNNPRKDSQMLYLEKKDRYEFLWTYKDLFPCLNLRITLMKAQYQISVFCYKIVTNRKFEILSISIILWNTIMLLIDDPATQNDQGNIFDEIFLIFYTMEMILKISGLGFFMNSNSYLRSGWNWLDMTIVITGFLPYLISSDGGNYNISVLRTFRVIRPLKTISTLKNLMIIVMTLFSALPYIFNALLILFFFLLIYAIIGLQLFSGYLKNRCFDKITGIMISQNFDSSYNGILCGYDICPDNSLCGKMLQNPNSNITNFDNFLWSILMMIQVITLENWSYNMDYVSRTCEYSGSLIFFISLAFLGAFVFLNLMASVISNSYHEQARIKIQKNEKFRLYNEDVIEYLKIRGEERLKRNFISMKRLKMRNFEFTYDEFYDMKSNTFIKLLPLEIELENHLADKNIDNLKQNNVISFDDLVDVCHKKRENEEEIKKPDKNYNINKIRNNISSMEELIVLNSIRQSPDKFLSINSSKKDSGDKEDNDKTQKSLIYTSRFNLSKEKNRQNKQSENTILDTNKPDKNALAEENEKNNKHENDKKNGKWLKTLRINRLFTRFQTDNLTKLKEKFKKFKLKVDHSFEYFSCSYADVAQKSIIAKKKLDEDIFQKRMKEGRFDVSYKMRQNFELNKRKIKEKFEHELVKKYRELNEKEGNNTMKKAFFYFTPHQIRLPLLIGTNSYVFQAKIENLLEKIMMKKKRKFHKSLFKNKIHKKIRRKKRLLSIKLVLEDIKFSMSEILNNYISDEEIEKEFSSKSDYKYIRNYDLETRKLNEKIEGIDIELNWSGKEVMNYTNLYNMEKIIQRIKQENKILMALTTKNQDKLIWVNGLAGKIQILRKNIRNICQTKIFEYLVLSAVILNTIVLSMNGYLVEPEQIKFFESINKNIVYIFIAEMAFKIFGFGPFDYAKSKSNLLDGIIVVISIVDLIGSSMDYKINIIRSLRILRVTRILRPLEYMIVITRVIVNKFYSFIYIYLLLILFMIIYTLIGNQIYINQLNPELTGIRQNFNTFYSSFLSVFQLVSMENWNDIETTTLNSNIPYAFTIFYLLSLIFFGNYVFLNLLLGVLLDGFSNINKLEEEDENNSEITLSLEELNRFKEIHHDDDDEKNDDILQNNEGNTTMNRNGRKNPTIQMNLDEEDIKRFLHLKKQDNDEKTFENPWELWHSEETLWYFKKSSWVRRISYIIVKSEYFNYFIYFLIFANSIKLARDTYLEKDTGSFIFEYILGGFLVGEAILKIIAFGFIFGKYTYLKNYWNVLDFFVVGATLADMTLTNYNLNYIKIFLLIRTLKLLSFTENMRIVVAALIKSIWPLLNLIMFTFIIFLIFALIGTNLLAGSMGFCSGNFSGFPYGINKSKCMELGYKWTNADANFDNVFNALITVFILCTQENWPFIMHSAMDSNPSEIGPSFNNFKYIGIYFILALTVLNFFLINLFVGVLCDQFIEAKEKADPNNYYQVNPYQKQWIEFQSFFFKVKPYKKKLVQENNDKENKFGIIFKKIIGSKIFESFLFLCIVSNIIILSMNYEGQTKDFKDNLEAINYLFTGVFILEAFLKILAMGIKKYFGSLWNIFDFFIVLTSFSEIIIDNELDKGKIDLNFLRIGPQIIRIFRILRVLRAFKLIKRFKTLKKLLATLISAIPSIANIGLLYLMIFYIYAIIGVILFKDVKKGVQINDYNNFSNAGFAILLCFKMVTGENWWEFMFDCYRLYPNCDSSNCGNALAPLFFISFQVIAGFIVQNLFILVIIQALENANDLKANKIFRDNTKKFKVAWRLFSHENPHCIKADRLIDFFSLLPEPLGFRGNKNDSMRIAVEIMKMNLQSDNHNNIYFHNVLFAVLKRAFGQENETAKNQATLKYLTQIELTTREKLEGLQKRYLLDEREKMINYGNVRRETKKITIIANPALRMLYLPMIFKTWKSFSDKKNKGLLSEDDENEVIVIKDTRKTKVSFSFLDLFKNKLS